MNANHHPYNDFVPDFGESARMFCCEDGTLTPVAHINGWNCAVFAIHSFEDPDEQTYTVWFGNGFLDEEYPTFNQAVLAARRYARDNGIELRNVTRDADKLFMGFLKTDADTTRESAKYYVMQSVDRGFRITHHLMYLAHDLGEEDVELYASTFNGVLKYWHGLV